MAKKKGASAAKMLEEAACSDPDPDDSEAMEKFSKDQDKVNAAVENILADIQFDCQAVDKVDIYQLVEQHCCLSMKPENTVTPN